MYATLYLKHDHHDFYLYFIPHLILPRLVMEQMVDASGVTEQQVDGQTVDRGQEELTQHTVYQTWSGRGMTLQEWARTTNVHREIRHTVPKGN